MGIPAAVYYPGLAQIQSATITMGHGITPNGFQLVIAPQPSNQVVEIGDLTLEYDNQTLVIPGCKVDSASFSFDESGNLIALSLQDRRWKWRYGTISGEYNIRRPDGTIQKRENSQPGVIASSNSEFTPHELARLCLEAAGEVVAPDAFVAMPNYALPYVRWDVSNPMAELANLADLLGCRVVLGLDNKVRIKQNNFGESLPSEGLMRLGTSFDYDKGPDWVVVVSAPYRFQLDFSLEAVGLDLNSELKPIDDLSYKPTIANGAVSPRGTEWQLSDPFTSHAFTDDEASQNLAIKTVFKWYRVNFANGRIPNPFDDAFPLEINNLSQVVPLPTQVFKENADGEWREKDAMVYGLWYEERDFAEGNVLDAGFYDHPDFIDYSLPPTHRYWKQVVRQSWSFDTDSLLVKFSDPMVMQGEDASALCGWHPAKLILRTSYYFKDEQTLGFVRAHYTRVIRNKPNPTKHYILREDIRPYLYAIYGDEMGPPTPIEVRKNEDACKQQAEYYLDQYVSEFNRPNTPQSATYAGWRFDIELDGAIQSITWSLSATGSDGPVTRIELNHDTGSSGGIPYNLRRAAQRQAEAARDIAREEFRKREEREIAKIGKAGF